jgi:hypothetical protein
MYTGDKVFYGLKLSKNKIFRLLFNYICKNELQNYIYEHELFKKSYVVDKDSNDEIDAISFNDIDLNSITLNNDVIVSQSNDEDESIDSESSDDEASDCEESDNDNNDDKDDKDVCKAFEDNNDDDKDTCKPQNRILLTIYEFIIDDDDRVKDMILLLFKILSFKYLTFLYQSCCDDKGIIFLGIELGRNHVTYRGIIDEHKNFNDYYDDFTNNILIMKEKIKKNKILYDEQFKKLINIKPKIYSMANDCYRCT